MSKKKCLLLSVLIFLVLFFLFGAIVRNKLDEISKTEELFSEFILSGDDEKNIDSDYENIPEFEGSIQGRLENNDTVVEYKSIDGIKRIDDIEFSNIKIGKISDTKCVLTADVKNLSKEFSKAKNVSVKVIDANGEVKESFGGILTDLAGLEPNKFKTYVLADVTYASDIELIEIKN